MSYHLTEEEQVEQLKRWWKQYGAALIVGIVLGLALLYGWQYWDTQTLMQSGQASELYDQLINEAEHQGSSSVATLGKQLQDDYPRSAYAALTGLFIAKQAITVGDWKKATEELDWVVAHAKNKSLLQIAQIRLARVLAEQKLYDKALGLLAKSYQDSFQGLANEVQGDVLLAMGRIEDAKKAYEQALTNPGSQSLRTSITMKLNNLPYLAKQQVQVA